MTKICIYCQGEFTPDRRVKNRQQCCGGRKCKLLSRKASREKWLEKNPGYFRGRYQSSTKPWFDKHPGYLREYRRRDQPVETGAEKKEKGHIKKTVSHIMRDKQDKITILFINGLINLVYQARQINKMRQPPVNK